MKILDGKNLSAKIKDDIKGELCFYKKTPILAVISVGNDPSSQIYVNNKKKACEYVGISFFHISFDENDSEEKIIEKIKELNDNKNVNGILLQLPLPDKFNEVKILNNISPLKDVDGLTEISIGRNVVNNDGFVPCTPKGIIKILDYYNIDLESKNVVIVGRSNLVGKPLIQECLKKNATVTVCHTKTDNLKYHTLNADVLIVATGNKYLIDKSMIKKDSVIIDVGINRVDGKIYGDVNPNVEEICSYLTPVPGGVGPMTVSMLLENVLLAYKKQNGK